MAIEVPSTPSLPSVERWEFAGWRFLPDSLQLFTGRNEAELGGGSARVLKRLLEEAPQQVSKAALLQAGWPGRVVTENSLFKAITRLRVVLEDRDAMLLRSEPGYGYRLVCELRRYPALEPVRIASALIVEPSPIKAPRWLLIAALATSFCAAAGITIAQLWKSERSSATVPPIVGATNEAERTRILLQPIDSVASKAQFATKFEARIAEQLSKFGGVDVVIGTQSATLSDSNAKYRTLILTGTLSGEGSEAELNLRLSNAASGVVQWAQRYRDDGSDTKADLDVARVDLWAGLAIEALRIEVLPEAERSLQRLKTVSAEAAQQYLLAVTLFKDDETSQRRAIMALRRAVELDPNFVQARFRLSDWLGHSGLYADTAEEALAGKEQAFAELEAILKIDAKHLAALHTRGAYRYSHYWDWSGGRADLQAARTLSGQDNLGYVLNMARLEAALLNWDAALDYSQKAVTLEPGVATVRAYHLLALERYDEAAFNLRLALTTDPVDEHAHYYLGLIELLQDRPSEAIRHFENSAYALRLTGLAIASAAQGDRESSERHLQLLIKRYSHILPYQVAEVYAWRGEDDLAFQWLNRSVELREASFIYLDFDPLMRNLHTDSRWQEIRKRVNLLR